MISEDASKPSAEDAAASPNSVLDDRADLVKKTGEVVESVLKELCQSEGDNRTISLIFNVGTMSDVFGTVQGGVTIKRNGEDGADAPSKPAADLPIEKWFESISDVRDAALMAAASFMPGAPYAAVLEASHRLANLIRGDTSDGGGAPNPFGTSRSARFARLGATIISTDDAASQGLKVERIAFVRPERPAEARRHLWIEAGDLRPALTRWLVELGSHENQEVAIRVGRAVGRCAEFAFAGMFDEIIQRWAFSDTPSTRVAAGQALGAAIELDHAREFARLKVREWSQSGSDGPERRAAASICRSAWGVAEPGEALAALKRLEASKRVDAFRWTQEAINTLWAGSSLFPEQHGHLASIIATTLRSWVRNDPKSIFYISSAIHLAIANRHELGLLTRNQRDAVPLIFLLSRKGSPPAADAAWLFNLGLQRKGSRQTVRNLFNNFAEWSCKKQLEREFSSFLNLMVQAGSENDRARLEHYVEGWNAQYGMTLRVATERGGGSE